MVGGNVVDVFLDDDLHQEYDHHVASRLKQPLVVPCGVLLRQLARNAIVLAQEKRVEHCKTGLRVGSIAAEGEQCTLVFLQPIGVQALPHLQPRHLGESVEFGSGLAVLEIEWWVFLSVDHLALEPAADLGADRLGDLFIHTIQRGEVDVMIGGVLSGPHDGRPARDRLVVGTQEAIGKPLGEVREQHGRLGRLRFLPLLPLEELGDVPDIGKTSAARKIPGRKMPPGIRSGQSVIPMTCNCKQWGADSPGRRRVHTSTERKAAFSPYKYRCLPEVY